MISQSSENLKSKDEKTGASGLPSLQQSKSFSSPQSSGVATAETPKPHVSDTTPTAQVASKAEPIATPTSALASEELVDLHRKLIEKEKAVVDLEEKLGTLKQKRSEDKNKLKEVEKLKMQNQQVC